MPTVTKLLETYPRDEVEINPSDAAGEMNLPSGIFESWSGLDPTFKDNGLEDLKGNRIG